ncbi:fibronectin type III domain-containing protein 3B-like [Cyprinus carpio]|uniref:Fibronectin type III domain-containing protein 3B-like n=1 Tax=Cyprinus carpio TaxID=7962 RepID=A0A9Q9VSL9_CYPCA|nr:fibronectin type III domain-containing protein 3B-like [Cyprinus carpio]
MFVTMMMMDQMLDLPPPLSNEVPMMHHMINGDAPQQVILVQVNPGETFTIRTEDGALQCIQGPAEVPMMSPNGSIPPIHVPPGYVSQVLEDNTGVRRVVVTPHSECYPPSYSPALSPSHHIHPPYLTHPHFIPASHTSYYPPVSPGDMPPHQFYQHRLPPIYPEEIIPLYNVSTFMGHEEYCKPPPKKLKQPVERTSPIHITNKNTTTYNNTTNCNTKTNSNPGGVGGRRRGGSPGNKRPDRRARGSPKHSDTEPQDHDVDTRRVQAVPSGMDKPQVSNVQSRSALVSWTSVSVSGSSGRVPSCSYELQLKDKGRDGKYKVVYSGEELQYTLTDLRPATDYHVRVSTVCNSMKGPSSDARAFTTHSAPPDTPLPPRLSHRTKSSLTLQWKPPVDNGSKITNYVLEWDEGKKNSIFHEYYVGHQRHCKVMGLCPAVGYTFRVAALNDIGTSGFSTEVVFNTTGSLPQTSLPPRLAQAGPSWVTLEWTRPNSCSNEEVVTYTLEMQDETKGLDFQAVYSGLELNRKVETLKRNTQYKFRLITCSGEWRSAPSSLLVCKTTPDRPGPPVNPAVNAVTYHNFCVTWEPPQDDGGSGDLTYVLEISEGNLEESQWVTLYRGPERKHLCEDLKPATSYSLRLSCVNVGGQSLCSDDLTVRTHIPPPGRCQSPRTVGNVKHKEMTLQWVSPDGPLCGEESENVEFSLEMCAMEEGSEPTEVYCGSKTECTVGNLLPGTTYRFQVRAANSAGYGPYSESVEISTAAGPPGQCSPPAINVRSHTCADVTWENKVSSGIDISEYRLDWGRDLDSLELVYSRMETCFQISNLEASADYCCRLQAVNQAGAGPYSDLVMYRTPAAAPDVVSGFCCVDHPLNPTDNEPFSHSTCLALTWDEPHCNGAEITSYSISIGDRIFTTRNETCHIIRDLLPDSEYSLQIRAENEMGPGPFSQTLTVRTRPLPPSPPRLECAAVGPQSLKLRWGFSSRSQLTDDTTYTLQMENRNQRFVVVYRGSSHTFKLQRLSESSQYRFRIQAVSEAGEGPFSETYTFSTTKSLPQTLKAPRVVQLEGNACEVTWESIPPMRGDRISYVLQVLGGRDSDYKQVYKGDETSFQLSGLQWNTDYRVRVFACRRCVDTLQELCGSFSPSAHFNLRRPDATLGVEADITRVPMGKTLTDEQFAGLIVFGVASLSVLMAFLLQLLI